MLQQLGGLWRWLQEQSPVRQAVIFATPIVAVALLVLGGLMVWAVSLPVVRPTATIVAAAKPTATLAANERAVIAVVTPTTLATMLPLPTPQTVLVPGRDGSPTASPTLTPIPEPTATPTPPPARSARVLNTEGQGANMRRAPSVSAQRVKVVPEGTVVELLGEEQRGDGYGWRNIRDAAGTTGFVIVDYLQAITGPPGATPVLPPPSIQVEEITSPIARGQQGVLTIVTRPGVKCELRLLIFGPATLPSEGLGFTTADADGFCSWTWTVPEDVVPGVWRYRISAGEGEGKAVREVSVVIT